MAVTKRPPWRLDREVGYHDLLADLSETGCPACHGEEAAAWRYLDSLLWEYVNDPGVRATLRASRGFCREHAVTMLRVAAKQGGGLGVAILYEDLLRTIAEHLASGASSIRRGRRGAVADPLPRPRSCPACVSARERARNDLRVLSLAGEGTEPWEQIRRPGRGLCVPHLALGLRAAEDAVQRKRLLEAYLHGERRLRSELAEFIRKHDYRYHDEGMSEDERTAPRRAVFRVVGEPSSPRPPKR